MQNRFALPTSVQIIIQMRNTSQKVIFKAAIKEKMIILINLVCNNSIPIHIQKGRQTYNN